MKMDKIINFILYLFIIFLIIYMLYIVYKCKKSDNQILVEKYYNFHNNKYENFIDYDSEKYTQKQNECINNWINNSDGMKTYLESLNDATRDVIINAFTNTECKKKITLSAPQIAPTTSSTPTTSSIPTTSTSPTNEEDYDEYYTEDVYDKEDDYDEDYTEDVYYNEDDYDEDYTEDVYNTEVNQEPEE